MPTIQLTVLNSVGLHARPAALFVRTSAQFHCDIKISNRTNCSGAVNAKSILSILTLGVEKGHQILVEAAGDSADKALTALQELVESNFGEDK